MTFAFLIPTVLWLVPAAVLVGTAYAARRYWRRANRRSPLTRGLLRGPAHSLREQFDEARGDLGAFMVVLPAFPLALYMLHLQATIAGDPAVGLLNRLFVLAALGALIFGVVHVFRKIKTIQSLRLGLEAELAVAEELNRLMHDDFWVFHDVPGDGRFNIDHVVVGQPGVFAIETKGRPKRSGPKAQDGHKVQYDGKALAFPGWRETEPLEQADRNAHWLRNWLSSAVGEPVDVQPVVILPGWFIERTSGDGIPVLPGRNSQGYFTRRRNAALSPKLVQQIVHQLDQRCRDVEPKAYARG